MPPPFIETSHLLSSLTGLLLMVIARGLCRRLAVARLAAIALLSPGAALFLAKGPNWALSGLP